MPEYARIGEETTWLANNLMQSVAQAIDLRYSHDPELPDYETFNLKLHEHVVHGKVTAEELRQVVRHAQGFEKARNEDLEMYRSCGDAPDVLRSVEQYSEHVTAYRHLQWIAIQRLEGMLEPVDSNSLYRAIPCDLNRLVSHWREFPDSEQFARKYLFVATQLVEASGSRHEEVWRSAMATLCGEARILSIDDARTLYRLANESFELNFESASSCRESGKLDEAAKFQQLATVSVLVRSDAEQRCEVLRGNVDAAKPFEPPSRYAAVPRRRGIKALFQKQR